MPIFEYQCPQCGFVNEVLVPTANVSAPACPKCGQADTHKRFSSFAAVVKNPAAGDSKCHTCPSAGGCPHSHA
ncbi:MAG: zinc ribbon domain-containing protein [Planctomycetaceae bacterium]|nr:zinc ribbon domain-containing protein [Planctomycetaceae bacterium]